MDLRLWVQGAGCRLRVARVSESGALGSWNLGFSM